MVWHPSIGTLGDVRRRGAALGLASALVLAQAVPALAAKPSGGGSGGGTTRTTGNDISYPQCGGAFPSGSAFGIVGVNDGLANTLNPCLGPSAKYPSYSQSELYWAAATSTGSTSQPKASLYVNTTVPGNIYNGMPIGDWPTSGTTPYGTCSMTTVTTKNGTYTVGQNSTACAWQYGDLKASQDAAWLTIAAAAANAQGAPTAVPTTAGAYPWWFDVETVKTWQSGSSGQAMNVADLQGMIAGLQAAGATAFGVYSTSTQWSSVVGSTALGSLQGLPDWVPGAKTLSGAINNCKQTSFTGGKVTITQYTSRIDTDYACT